jgi:hypothetical protein
MDNLRIRVTPPTILDDATILAWGNPFEEFDEMLQTTFPHLITNPTPGQRLYYETLLDC